MNLLLSNELALYFIFAALALWPMAQVFRRAGFSPLWALAVLIPPNGMILCAFILAMRRWPAAKKGA